MKDMREIVLYFGKGSKLNPLDIAKSLTDRYDELGSPQVNAPEVVQKTGVLVEFKENPDMMLTVTMMTVNMVVNHSYFDKMDTIIFDLVDMFDELNISLIKMGLVYSMFFSPDDIKTIYNKYNIPADMEEIRLAWYRKLDTKNGKINCWERIITDKEKFPDLLIQLDFNTVPDSNANFDMKFIKDILSVANDYSEERSNF